MSVNFLSRRLNNFILTSNNSQLFIIRFIVLDEFRKHLFNSYWNNIGELKNQGLEFSVSSQNIRTSDFSWTTDFNLTKQSIKVNKLPNGDDVQSGG